MLAFKISQGGISFYPLPGMPQIVKDDLIDQLGKTSNIIPRTTIKDIFINDDGNAVVFLNYTNQRYEIDNALLGTINGVDVTEYTNEQLRETISLAFIGV